MPKLIGPVAVAMVLLVSTATAAVANDNPIVGEKPGGVQVGAQGSGGSAGPGSGHDRGGTSAMASASSPPSGGTAPAPLAPTAVMTIGRAALVTPAMLAQQAYRFLPLPAPGIHTNPPADREQLVWLPTWLWVSGASWGTRMATASIPTLSVTVTAVPVTVAWTMGDGGRVVCGGPGTPFDAAHSARQPSCAYTYQRSSAGQPTGRFTVTATTTWTITWTAGGSVTGGGTLPPLARSAQTTLAVAEVQAINTPNDR